VSSSPAAQWVAAPSLIWETYPDSDDWVVYNPASADIHLLTPFARRLLQLADQTPCALESLVQLLADDLALSVDSELHSAVESATESLDSAGLLSRVFPPSL
jgi:PqqD family protein of HPr-rel-A system